MISGATWKSGLFYGFLDESEFGFEAGKGGLFFGELLLGFLDELFGGFFEVAGVGEAEVEGVYLAAEGENFVFEVLFVLFEGISVDVEVDFAVGEGDAHATGGVSVEDGGGVGEELNKDLIVVDEGVVAEQ